MSLSELFGVTFSALFGVLFVLEEAPKLALDKFRLLQPHLEQKRPLRLAARILERSTRWNEVSQAVVEAARKSFALPALRS